MLPAGLAALPRISSVATASYSEDTCHRHEAIRSAKQKGDGIGKAVSCLDGTRMGLMSVLCWANRQPSMEEPNSADARVINGEKGLGSPDQNKAASPPPPSPLEWCTLLFLPYQFPPLRR